MSDIYKQEASKMFSVPEDRLKCVYYKPMIEVKCGESKEMNRNVKQYKEWDEDTPWYTYYFNNKYLVSDLCCDPSETYFAEGITKIEGWYKTKEDAQSVADKLNKENNKMKTNKANLVDEHGNELDIKSEKFDTKVDDLGCIGNCIKSTVKKVK